MNAPAHDTSVNYLGLELRSPLVPSASPLGAKVESLQEMEESGAGAVVLPSLFEYPLEMRARHPEYYFDEITQAKACLKIPVIASLNASTTAGWASLAARIAEAGADALELNIYQLSLSPEVPAAQVERAYLEVVETVTNAVGIPVSIKLSPYFTNLTGLAKQLREAGASGLVLFNRFYQSDLDLLSMGPGYTLRLSTSAENRLPMRWIALLYQHEIGYLAASTGIRTGADVLKMILSGASVTQLCSILLQRGIPWLKIINEELHDWMEACHITSLRAARGSLSHRCVENPEQLEREEYRKALQGYAKIDVPSWHDEVPLRTEAHHKTPPPVRAA